MSRHHAPAVVRYEDPARTRRRRALLVLGIGLALAVTGWLGYRQGALEAGRQPLAVDGPGLESTLLQTRSAVDAETITRLRQDIADLGAANLELEQELSFYRSVMAPGEGDEPVLLRAPRFEQIGEDTGLWQYEFVVQQGTRRRGDYRGELAVRIEGSMAGVTEGEPVRFALKDLAKALGGSSHTLRFRYFQRIRGELRLPEGFMPERVILEASLTEPGGVTVQAAYDWAESGVAGQPPVSNGNLDSRG